MDNSKRDVDAILTQIQPIILDYLKQIFPDEEERNFATIIELVKGVQLSADDATRELALNFLCEAERDLKSCKALRCKKIYPYAVYHLQQAVEKATKGYVLGFGLLGEKDIRAISHDTPMLFLKALVDKTGLRSWANQPGNQGLKQRIDNAYQAVNEEAKRQEIVRTSRPSIKKQLSEIDRYRSISRQLCQYLRAKVTPIVGVDLPLQSLQFMLTLPTLFILGVISFPHEEYTRYPDRGITPSDYIASLGIVQSIPDMMKYLSREIRELKEVLSP